MKIIINKFSLYTDTAAEQEQLWQETVDDTPATEKDAQCGEPAPTQVDRNLLLDVEILVSRLVAKAGQLIGNFTTNLAENWMSIRCKFDGGKVINRCQSGSWEHRCMGAGLRLNIGPNWGPQVWRDTTRSEPNPILVNTANKTAEKREKDRKRKQTEEAKERRRQSKYPRVDDTAEARKSYSRHDGGIEPDEVSEDLSPEHLDDLKQRFYQTKVVVNQEQTCQIEVLTRSQRDTEMWMEERRKRITASNVGSVAKMKASTKRAKKVEQLLYSRFTGSKATRYGCTMEEVALREYTAYQQQHGHPGLKTEPVGLCISTENPWLAASPDSTVHDLSTTPPSGLVELKNPYSAKDMTVEEYSSNRSSCLNMREDGKCELKRGHDYFYQVQCQLYCTGRAWCDFVVRTNKGIHVERIHQDRDWWNSQMKKCQKFYFNALLPELACPRYGKGGIREPKDTPT